MTPDRPQTIEINLPDAAATTAFAQWIAGSLRAGDAVLLSGNIGAGKTHFARAVIRARMPEVTDIPSPSFTLIQRYEGAEAGAGVAIMHADLYRLTHPDEVTELGLDDAAAQDICLIEWPERMADPPDGHALRLHFAMSGDGRRLTATGPARLMTRVAAFPGAAGAHV
jgi:tRNA threonylcarbamoyl adenosine modification protein YjeE